MEMEKVSDIGTHRLSDVVGLTGSSPNFVANIKRISELINFRPPPPKLWENLSIYDHFKKWRGGSQLIRSNSLNISGEI